MAVAKVMMPVTKRTICLLLAVCMMALGLPFTSLVPEAQAATSFTDGAYTAYVLSEPDGDAHGTCKVTSISADALDESGVLSIPGTLVSAGATYDVTSVACSGTMSSSYGGSVLDGVAQGTVTRVVLPSTLTEVGQFAFNWCTSLESVVFPDDCKVAVIGSAAFKHCTKLASVTIPASVEKIAAMSSYFDYGAFKDCTSLKSVSFEPGSRLSEMLHAFYGCTALETVDLGGIGSALASASGISTAFGGCGAVRSVVLPDSACASMAPFTAATSITSVTLPENCSNLKRSGGGEIYSADGSTLIWWSPEEAAGSITLPQGCVSLGAYSLCGCKKATSISIPGACAGTTVGDGALRGCTSLSSVDFGGADVISSVGAYAFAGCTSLESIDVPGLVAQSAKLDYYTEGSGARSSAGYIIQSPNSNPVGRAGLGNFAFQGCTSLKAVRFGAAPGIGCYALVNRANNSFRTDNLTESNAFAGCTSLESIAFDGRQPYWMDEEASIGSTVQGSGFYTYACYIEYFSVDRPQFYYGVDYYATKVDAEAGENRIATLEVARGASTSAIATGDAEALAGFLYSESSSVPDPNEVASANGMLGDDWVWAFEDGYGDYADLYDSCYVYLAHSGDLSMGHAESAQLSAMREPLRSTRSTSFDPERWFGENKWDEAYTPEEGAGESFTYSKVFDSTYYDYGNYYGSTSYSRFDGSCCYTWGADGLVEDFEVVAADGTPLREGVDYELTCQTVAGTLSDNAASVELEYATAGRMLSGVQPILVTVKALEGGKCNAGTSFSRWVLARSHSETASVKDKTGGDSAAYTATAGKMNYGSTSSTCIQYNPSFTVNVFENDPVSALIGSGYAGLLGAELKVYSGSDGVLCFTMMTGGDNRSFDRLDGEAASETANADFSYWEKNRASWGGSATDYPWDGAVLVDPTDQSSWYAAATLAYSLKACVLFAEEDGTVSKYTLANLKKLGSVTIVGSEGFATAAGSSMGDALDAGCVSCVTADAGDACGYSLAAADCLLANGSTASTVAIVNGSDLCDTVAAQDLSGYEAGLTLVSCSSADSKRVCAYLRAHRDDISQVLVYGRDTAQMSTSSFDPAAFLQESLWDESDGANESFASACEIAVGDTMVISNIEYELCDDGTLAMTGEAVGGIPAVAVTLGDIVICGGKDYVVSKVTGSFRIDIAGAAASGLDGIVYNGTAQEPVPAVSYKGEVLEQGTDWRVVSYSNNIDAGTGYVKVEGLGSFTGTWDVPFEIAKADCDMSDVTFSNRIVTYTGKAHSIECTGELPEGVEASYAVYDSDGNEVKGAVDAGTYTVTASFSVDDAANYNAPASMTATLTIAKAAQTVAASKGTSKTVTYKKAKSGKYKNKLKATKTVTAAQMKAKFGLSAQGTLVFAKANAKGGSMIAVSSAGKVTVRKGLKKGAYKVKIKVTAKATNNYKASAAKYVWLIVKVK